MKNLVTFKRKDVAKDEKLWYFGRSLKNPTFKEQGRGNSQKPDVDGGLPKKGDLNSLQI